MTNKEAVKMVDNAIKSEFFKKCKIGRDLAEALGIVVRLATNAIANGIPYNQTGDLISREALKEAFKDCTGECACCIHNTNDFEYCGLIDNAPTVKPCDNCDLYFIAKTKEEMRKGGAE